MKKIQCPNIEKGENVHLHYCNCCKGKQHIPFIVALKYNLSGLLVLDSRGKDASDDEMHRRIEDYIAYFKNLHKVQYEITFTKFYYSEPICTLTACIQTLNVKT